MTTEGFCLEDGAEMTITRAEDKRVGLDRVELVVVGASGCTYSVVGHTPAGYWQATEEDAQHAWQHFLADVEGFSYLDAPDTEG